MEVDIVLPENMLVKEAHDIGEALQKKIEHLPEVERVYFIQFFFVKYFSYLILGICSY